MKVQIGVLVAISTIGACAAAAESPKAPLPPAVSALVITASKTVSELTVTAKLRCLPPEAGLARAERPRVVSSFPARGAEVRPGLLVVRVTFDQPMACAGSFDAAPPLPNPCPGASRQMLLSYDRRTVRTVCAVEPGSQYGLSFGQDPNAETFLGLAGLPAAPSKIVFTTSSGPAIADACEALAEDPQTAAELRRRGKSCAAAPLG